MSVISMRKMICVKYSSVTRMVFYSRISDGFEVVFSFLWTLREVNERLSSLVMDSLVLARNASFARLKLDLELHDMHEYLC